jgi:hypothetical protein
MTDIPQDAPRSEDGQWWWDGSQWQPVGGQGAQSGTPGGGSTAGAGGAEFGFDMNGVSVQVDDSDNPDNHVNLHVNAGTEVGFTVCNMGSAQGTATVTVFVDDKQVQTWTSGQVPPSDCAGTNVSGCGRYNKGTHVFRVLVTPGHAGNDSTTNTTDVDDS